MASHGKSLANVISERALAKYADDQVAAGRDPKRPPTVMEYGRTAWASGRLGSRVLVFVVEWAWQVGELGADATHAAIQRESSMSSATFYRRLVEFRELFPEYDDPTPVAEHLLACVEGRKAELHRAVYDADFALAVA